GQRTGAGGTAQSAWHCDREADVQGVPDTARLPALAARLQRRRPPATPAVGQHGHEGSRRVRRPLYQGARRAVHGEHDARRHLEGPGRSWSARRDSDRRRWRRRGSVGPVRRGRHRCGRPRQPAPGRRRQVLRQLLARAHGRDRREERRPGQGELSADGVGALGGLRLLERTQDTPTASEERKGRPMTGMLPLTARQSWKAPQAHQEKIRELHLRTLFVDDATRGERMSAEAVGIYLDYSKNRVTDETLALLCRLAE